MVRHGKTVPYVEGNPFPLKDGHGDPDLAPEGVMQAKALAERLASWSLEAVYVTPLRRTLQTAQPLLDATGMEAIVEPDLREVYLGEWEGGVWRKKIADGDPLVVEVFTRRRWDVIPGAESNESFAARVRAAVERIANAHPSSRVLVVAHGGTIAEICAQAAGTSCFHFLSADNASISRVVVGPHGWFLRCFNDTAHLDSLDAG